MIKRVARLVCVLAWVVCSQTYAKSDPIAPTHPVVLADDNQRYLCVALLNTTEGPEEGLSVLRAAAKQGCNAAMITVRWDVVHEKITASTNWTQYDNQIKLCKELGLKVFLRVHLARCCNRSEGYWPESEAAKDQEGRILKDIFSMSHQSSVDQSLGFVKEVCERYLPYQQEGQILCLAATTTTTQEAGYHYEGYISDGGLNFGTPYLSAYDFSPSMVTGFRNWLLAKYGDLKTINENWRSDFSEVSDIQPISTNYAHPENKRWSDWYLYRHSMLKNFLDGVSRSAKGVDGSYKVINDFGSVHDGLSFRRGTLAFKDLARNTDGTKINDAQSYNHYFSADVLRSSMGNDKWIMNEAFKEPGMSQYGMELMLNQHFERGCKLVNIVAGSTSEMDWFAPSIQAIAKNWLKKPMTPIVPVQKIVVKLSELVKTGSYFIPGYMSRWEEKNTDGPVEVKLIEDLLGEPENNQAPIVKNPLADYSITSGMELTYPIPENAFLDPDGKIEFYEVSGLPTGLFLDKNTIKGSSTLVGNYTITVKANDAYDASVSATFTLRVTPQKQAGLTLYKAGNYLSRSLIRTLKNTDTLNINALGFAVNFFAVPDASAKAVVMKLSGAINQTRTETDAPFALYGDDGGTTLKVGNYELVIESYNSTVIIPNNAIGRSVFNFVVANQRINQAPVVLTPLGDQQTTINRTFNLMLPVGSFQDKDGQIVRVVITGLPAGLKATGWQISGVPTQAGNFPISVEVFDNENASVKTQFTLRVASVNQAPTATMVLPDQTVMVQQLYEYNIPVTLFSDSDGYVVRIIAQNTPSGISLVGGKLTGKPTVAGDYRILIRAMDNEGAWGETSFRLLVKETAANMPPLVENLIPNQTAKVGSTFNYTLPKNTFRDPEGGEIRTEVTNLPSGLIFSNGAIVGMLSTAGEFQITVRGYDVVGASVGTSFTLSVSLANNNIPPSVVAPMADQNATVGQPFELAVPISIFRDPDGSLFGLLVRNLPPGLVFQGGKITGTPTAAGNYTVTIRAIDNQGASAEDYFVIKVVNPESVTTDFVFSLYKAGGSASRSFVRTLRHNDRIVASTLPSFINIFVEAIPQVERIEFTLTGPIEVTFTDYNSPYGLFDDNGGFSSVPGTYTLKVKGIKNNKAVGETTIQFVLTDGKSARIGGEEPEEINEWASYPNPFRNALKIVVPLEYQASATDFSVIDFTGQRRKVQEVKWDKQQAELNLEPLQLPKGLYLLQVQHPDYPIKIIKILREE
ncbi:MAG: putative Ig domain-containing protein [Spirosomataceae bacterium]